MMHTFLHLPPSQLALPPSSFVQVSQLLKKHNYSKDKPTRIVIEKPFGKVSPSAALIWAGWASACMSSGELS